jgi:hypothetical protein
MTNTKKYKCGGRYLTAEELDRRFDDLFFGYSKGRKKTKPLKEGEVDHYALAEFFPMRK